MIDLLKLKIVLKLFYRKKVSEAYGFYKPCPTFSTAYIKTRNITFHKYLSLFFFLCTLQYSYFRATIFPYYVNNDSPIFKMSLKPTEYVYQHKLGIITHIGL